MSGSDDATGVSEAESETDETRPESDASLDGTPGAAGRRRLPRYFRVLAASSSWLQRLRRAFLLLSLIATAILAQLLLASDAAYDSSRAAAILALAWLAFRWTREYFHRSRTAWWDCADGVALALAGSAITDLQSVTGIAYLSVLYSSLCFRSLSLSGRRVIIGVLVYFNTYIGTVAVSQFTSSSIRPPMLGFEQLPSLTLLAVATYLLALTLTRRDDDAVRQEALASAAARLATTSTEDDVARCVLETAKALTGDGDVTGMAVVARHADGGNMTLLAGDGILDRRHSGTIDIGTLSDRVVPRLEAGRVVAIGPADAGALLPMLQDVERMPSLTLSPLVDQRKLLGLVAITGSSPSARAKRDLCALGEHAAIAMKRLRADGEIREREATYRSLVEHASDAVLVVSTEFTILFVSSVAARLFRHAPSDLLDGNLIDLVHPDDQVAAVRFLEALNDDDPDMAPVEWRMRRGDGTEVTLETTGANLLDHQQIHGLLLTSRDVSDRKVLERRLVHQAYHDPLTGLANRAMFLNNLKVELARPLLRSVSHAVLFLDLDRFKIINDTLGHEAGDHLLRSVAERLRVAVRAGDLVARLGGDEFAILLHDIIDDVPPIEVAERILRAMDEPVDIAGHRLFITTSIGVALGSSARDQPEDLIRQADIAMYHAKRHGKACYALYGHHLDTHAVERLDLESDLRSAIQRQQIEIFYQPIVSLKTNRVEEFEALVRWRHPRRGLLGPMEFIELAEETGLILPIGQHVLRESCRQLSVWQAASGGAALRMSVNLSPRQFLQPSLVEDVSLALQNSGLMPGSLTLEITENAAMVNMAATTQMLEELKSLGVQIAIDDFGIGYSALNTLKSFPVDMLKIDRSFVRGLGADRSDTAIVDAVVACAKAMDLRVTAEGIETAEQFKHLRSLDCNQGQGFLISVPLSHSDIPPFLTQSRVARPRPVVAAKPEPLEPIALVERSRLKHGAG